MYIGELNGTPVGDLRLAASDRGLVAVEWARPQQLPIVVVPGGEHFFHGRLNLLAQIVVHHCR